MILKNSENIPAKKMPMLAQKPAKRKTTIQTSKKKIYAPYCIHGLLNANNIAATISARIIGTTIT